MTTSYTLKLTRSLERAMEDIGDLKGFTKARILHLAIGLLKFAYDEEEKGNKIVSISPVGSVLKEVVLK